MRARHLVVALLVAPLAACSTPPPESGRTELVVFAAASLSQVFPRLAGEFEAATPGVTVRFSFDGSATLVDQLAAGAPADVLATADRPTMDAAVTARLVTAPQEFASNVLTLIVPRGNPAGITGLDSSLDGTKLVVCADGVPCGSATATLARSLGVSLHPVSEETKVTDVRGKVETGQADAGIVYATDARAAGDRVEAIPIPGADAVRNAYLAGVPAAAEHAGLAGRFVDFLRSAHGQEVLGAAGFGKG